MAEAATILVTALVTVSVALSAVARTLDLVSIAHNDVAPFSPTGGTLPFLDKRGRELLENVGTLKDHLGDPVVKSDRKIEELETDLERLRATDEDTEPQEQEIEHEIEGHRQAKRINKKLYAFQDRIAETALRFAGWYTETVVRRIWPPLGFFTFLHTLNIILLWFAFVGIDAVVDGGRIYVASKVIVAVIWLLLPVLEIPEYSRIIAANDLYLSVPYYVFVTLLTVAYSQFILRNVFVVTLLFLLNLYYLRVLKTELERVSVDS